MAPHKGGTCGPLRSRRQRERDDELAAALWCEGKPLREIGEALGVSTKAAHMVIQRLRQAWAISALAKVEERVADELARIDHLEAVAWDAWERSKRDAMTLIRTKTPLPSKQGRKRQRVKEQSIAKGQCGDPRYLERVAWCVDQRCKILGLHKNEAGGVRTTVTVVNGIDLAAVTGAKKAPQLTVGQVQALPAPPQEGEGG